MEKLGSKGMQLGLTFTENDVASHSTDVFRPISQEVSMKNSDTVWIRPVSMNQEGPYEFRITQRGDAYVQLNRTMLSLSCKVVTSTGGDVPATDGIGIINLLGNSLFKSIEIEIGGKAIPELHNTHANYKAYLETLLSYNADVAACRLRASGWHLDTAGHYDDAKYHATNATYKTKNKGLTKRRTWLSENATSKTMPLMFPLHCDFFNCDRLLPPGVDLTVKLIRATDNFILLHNKATNNYKVQLSDLKLRITHVRVANAIIESHKVRILKEPVLLPIKKTEVKTHTYPGGLTDIRVDNVFFGEIPKTIIFGMVDTDSYNGAYKKNPYNFKNNNISHVSLIVNNKNYPTDPYTPNFANSKYTREYRDLFDNTGVGVNNIGNAVTYEQFAGGCTLFAFDLTPDLCNAYHWHKREIGGQVSLDLRFRTPLEKSITVMVFGVFDAIVAIDNLMNVTVAL